MCHPVDTLCGACGFSPAASHQAFTDTATERKSSGWRLPTSRCCYMVPKHVDSKMDVQRGTCQPLWAACLTASAKRRWCFGWWTHGFLGCCMCYHPDTNQDDWTLMEALHTMEVISHVTSATAGAGGGLQRICQSVATHQILPRIHVCFKDSAAERALCAANH